MNACFFGARGRVGAERRARGEEKNEHAANTPLYHIYLQKDIYPLRPTQRAAIPALATFEQAEELRQPAQVTYDNIISAGRREIPVSPGSF